ncbi:MAG: hypothetical protein PHP42_10510 [Bacteroidota bacterium]|nr:hypothetical protein [Bacteroidota bacterium]
MRSDRKLSIVNCLLTIIVLLLTCNNLFAQEKDSLWLNNDWYYSTEDSSAVIDFTNFLPPFFKDEAHLKRYVRDDKFFELRKLYDDTLAIDAIFDQAMLLADDDVAHALWIATFSVMDHRKVGLKVPVLGNVYLPLTSESDSLFRVRRTNLPKHVLSDYESKRVRDKDKLQHFFGSALITYLTNSSAIALWFGDLLEKGERSFVLGGRYDERDRMANALGREFGLRLLKDEQALPSDVLWQKIK